MAASVTYPCIMPGSASFWWIKREAKSVIYGFDIKYNTGAGQLLQFLPIFCKILYLTTILKIKLVTDRYANVQLFFFKRQGPGERLTFIN